MSKKLGSYECRVLLVDLSRRNIEILHLDKSLVRKYIGGVGLAARILWDETTADTEPLSEDNPLLFMLGPLNALVPSSSRYTVAAISPLTGIWGEAHAGGSWAYQLRCAGFAGIIFKGKAEKPVYLWVNDENARLVDAGHLWGVDAYEVRELLCKETDAAASVAAIGPAGERLVRLAAIITEGSEGRTAARCGLGAVMGSKNLKAVVVRGKGKPPVYDEAGLTVSIEKYFPKVASDVIKEARKDYFLGASRRLSSGAEIIFKNYRQAETGQAKAVAEKLAQKCLHDLEEKPYYCRTCRTGGFECNMNGKKRGSVAYAKAGLGALCLIDDMQACERAYEICNRLGVDVISTGGVLAFAMEAFERGLITRADTDGLDLSWGNHEAMVQLVDRIGRAEGFGRVLGEGVRKAAEQIGGGASEFALHVKGLELPQRNPCGSNSRALEYATGSRGACQVSGPTFLLARAVSPDLGIFEVQEGPEKRFTVPGKGELVAKMQNFGCLLNSLTVCVLLFSTHFTRQSVQPTHFVEWLNHATGSDMDLAEFLTAGERIFTLKRLFNLRRGVTAKDDTLPPRILEQMPRSDAADDHAAPLVQMLDEYYGYRGWDSAGRPKAGKLAELGLADGPCLDALTVT